jgi:MtaA/CmuA family methyltransferase
MNSMERFKSRLKGGPVDRPPNFDIFMTFACHYIHQPLSRYYQDHRVLCDANMAVQEAFGIDIVQAISDPYREAADFGLKVTFPEDNLPLAEKPLLIELSDVKRMANPTPDSGRMSDRVAAVAMFHNEVGGEIPVMGWVEGALAEAADIRGVSRVLMDLYDNTDWLVDLLERIVEVEIAFAKAQAAAGADIIGLGDAIASQISTKMYRRFALPYEKRIFDTVHEMGALARLHICGNTSHILTDMLETGADIIDLDWMVDFDHAAKTYSGKAAACGNFNPVSIMLQGTPQEVYDATLQCLAADPERIISAAGCEIPDRTPPANLLAQKRALEEFNQS